MNAAEVRISLGLAALLVFAAAAFAGQEAGQEAAKDERLLERARELASTTRRWTGRRQVLTLTIEDGRGNQRVRKLAMLTRRDGPGEEKTLAVFLEPADVRGTGFLQHVPNTGPSSQWLYLPELGRVRQINARGRLKSFMGTDFSYADLDLIENVLQWTDEDAAARRIDTERADDTDERGWYELRPLADASAYDRIVVQLTEQDVLLRSMEMYTESEAPEKVLLFEDIRDVGGIPTAFRLDMSRPDRGTRTRVVVSGLRYDDDLPDAAFTKRGLERGLDHVD